MPGTAAKIRLTEKLQNILQQLARATTSSVRIAQRARIILLGYDKMLNQDIAVKVGLHADQVGKWRRRWNESFEALTAIECRESTAELTRAVEQVLSDAPRSGHPGTFTAEQVTQILAVACEPPKDSGRPIERWTPRELADEVIQRGIVTSISVSQVGRYLDQADLQPHRSKYWLNTKEKDPQVFQQQVETVCQTYLDAPALYFQENTYTVSVDEMPGLQALERIEKTIPMEPGKPDQAKMVREDGETEQIDAERLGQKFQLLLDPDLTTVIVFASHRVLAHQEATTNGPINDMTNSDFVRRKHLCSGKPSHL